MRTRAVVTQCSEECQRRSRRDRAVCGGPIEWLLLFGSDAAKAEVLDLEELLESVLRTFTAEPRLLHAAKRCDLGGDDARIDADDSVLERLSYAPDAADVTAVEVGGEPELGRVGQRDGVAFLLEAEQWRDGAKGLLAGDRHGRRHLGENCRLEKSPAERVTLAADQHLRAFGGRVGDVAFHFFDGAIVDERTLRRRG